MGPEESGCIRYHGLRPRDAQRIRAHQNTGADDLCPGSDPGLIGPKELKREEARLGCMANRLDEEERPGGTTLKLVGIPHREKPQAIPRDRSQLHRRGSPANSEETDT